jgi:adenosylhomocysteine nucleosidase
MGIDLLPARCTPGLVKPNSQNVWYIGHGSQIDIQMANFAMNVFFKLYVNGIDCQVSIFDHLPYECCIKSSTSESAEYHCNQFNAFMNVFRDGILIPTTYKSPQLIHICPQYAVGSSKIGQRLFETQTYMQISKDRTEDCAISKTQYEITKYLCTENRRKLMENKSYDFGIITVLPEELNAIINVFNLKRLTSKFGERVFYTGSVLSESGTARSIICTQTVNQGEMSASNAYHEMKAKYRPSIIFLIGIAGGVVNKKKDENASSTRPELDLCDVVIAKSIIDYEMRKETGAGVDHRGQVFNANASIALIVNDFLVRIEQNPIDAVENSKNNTINVLFEAIGSGNAVIADDNSPTRNWLKQYNSKVAAVEMEASGVSSSFYETAVIDDCVKGLVVVRGISDLADIDKALCKQYRGPAAQNAALVSKILMEQFPEM